MESAKLPGGVDVSFGKASIDKPRDEKALVDISATALGDWKKTGNVFWLAHDIMWTIDAILRNARGNTILHGLRQSLHHLSEIGLEGSSPGIQLKRLYENAKQRLESEWTSGSRNQYSVDLRSILDQIGKLAEFQQPGYRSRANKEEEVTQ